MSNIKKNLINSFTFVLMVGFVSSTAVGQQAQQQTPPQPQMQQPQKTDIEVSDKELQKFSNAIDKAQTIQQNAQGDMIQAIKDEGLTVDEYKQIVQSTQQAQQGQQSQANFSQEKMEKARNASQAVGKIQSQTQEQVVQAIQNQGMQPDRFQQILMAIRSDKELQERFQDMQKGQTANN